MLNEIVSSEDLSRSVDALLFSRIDFLLDGGVFRLAATLNALGIRTDYSCEGFNPLHRNTAWGRRDNLPISMPHINIVVDNRYRPIDTILGKSRLTVPPLEALSNLLREYNREKSLGNFSIIIQGDKILCAPSPGSAQILTLEDHQKAIAEFNAFAEWLISRFFQKNSSVEEAVVRHTGCESSPYTLDDIPSGIIMPGYLDTVVPEYQNKGLPVTIAGIISRTKHLAIKMGIQ